MKTDILRNSESALSRFRLPGMIAATTLFSIIIASVALAQQINLDEGVTILVKNDAPAERGSRPGPPPKEAVTACESKAENMSCNFLDSRRKVEIEGTCHKPPQGAAACVPNDAPPPPKA